MAQTDRARFLRQMIESERAMDDLFQALALDIGNAVLRGAQDADGIVPIQVLPQLQREAARMVRARFLGVDGQAFDENNEPLAEFPRVIAEGQRAMIEVALERAAAILDRYLPEDIANKFRVREIKE